MANINHGRLQEQETSGAALSENAGNNEDRAWSVDSVLDLSYMDLDVVSLAENFVNINDDEYVPGSVKNSLQILYLHHNRLDDLPQTICHFLNLRLLDISNNQMTEIPNCIVQLVNLNSLIARGNNLNEDSFPKDFGTLLSLEVLNISGNVLKFIPHQLMNLESLKSLYLGGNHIEEISHDIWKLERLEVLYLGGNNLQEIPAEVGRLQNLQALVLCENHLHSLPHSISNLRRLRSLALHKNNLTTLPPEIVTLRGLVELSLRDNPLVVRFAREMTYDPPSLLELAARCIKITRITYTNSDLPANLFNYLALAQRCVNPKCKGVYFDARIEHIKFVDFCGKYRLPLLQYLCSPSCTSQPTYASSSSSSEAEVSDDDEQVAASKLKRVLLG